MVIQWNRETQMPDGHQAGRFTLQTLFSAAAPQNPSLILSKRQGCKALYLFTHHTLQSRSMSSGSPLHHTTVSCLYASAFYPWRLLSSFSTLRSGFLVVWTNHQVIVQIRGYYTLFQKSSFPTKLKHWKRFQNIKIILQDTIFPVIINVQIKQTNKQTSKQTPQSFSLIKLSFNGKASTWLKWCSLECSKPLLLLVQTRHRHPGNSDVLD